MIPENMKDADNEAKAVESVQHMTKAQRDAYYNTDELKTFA